MSIEVSGGDANSTKSIGTSVYISDLGVIALILALGFALYTIVVGVLAAVLRVDPLVASAKRSVLAVALFMLLA